jgi:ubiquinol-cytochrome c reductase cytochrome c1 subunit
MKALRALAAAAAFVIAGLASAAGPEMRMEPFLGDVHDEAQLQRGARLFVNYCLNCHGAQYMRYNRLRDIGLTEDQIRDYLIFTGVKVGERMTVGMTTKDAKSWFGGPVPDLTLEARVRGPQWVYNYLLGFYRDQTPTGWNNLVFPGVAMPHVLWQVGGSQKLVVTDYKSHDEAKAALIGAKGMGVLEPLAGKGGYAVKTLALDAPGQMSAAEYRAAVQDLVTFLDYISEPAKLSRGRIGIVVLMFLGVLFVLALWLKKEYWKDVR